MSAAKEINVYNRIADGEYICSGSRLYTRGEMKKMLKESGFSLDEVKEIYDLNAETAWHDMSETIESGAITNVGEKDLKFPETGYTFKKLYSLHKGNDFLWYLFGAHLAILLLFSIAIIALKKEPVMILLVVGVSLLSCLSGLFIAKISGSTKKSARKDISQIEDIVRYKMSSIVNTHVGEVFSICNTICMYECMEEVIFGATADEIDDDDLK